jgi:hypothetical protein
MNKRARLSRIFDECLERIEAGRSTVDECLRMFPDDVKQLAPMLKLAVEAREAFAPSEPRPDYVAASHRRIKAILSLRQLQAQEPRRQVVPARRWRPAQAIISLVLAISVLAMGTGVVQAASGALPGDPLYGIKRGIERARLVVSWSASGHAVLLAQHANERLAEVEELLETKRYDDIGLALDGLDDSLSGISNLSDEDEGVIDPDLMAHILDRLAHHQEVLQRVREQVPDNAKAAIERALERSSHSMEVILQLSQGGSPSDLAPGQQRTPPGHQRTPPGQEGRPTATDTPEPTETSTPTPVPPTATPTPVPTIHVRDLDVVQIGGPSENKEALVTIHVVTNTGINAGFATVRGSWTISGEGAQITCLTTPSGRCTVGSGKIPAAAFTTFTVTGVTHPTFNYNPWDNSDPEGDSNGTTITIILQ